MMHKCIIVKIGEEKLKFSRNREKFINFAEMREFINFVEIGRYAICIIDLEGWTLLVEAVGRMLS